MRILNHAWSRWVVYVVSIGVLIGAWQYAGDHSSEAFLASFTETVSRVYQLFRSGDLGPALWTSGQAFLAGVALSIAIGLPLGVAFGRVRLLREVVEPYVYTLYAIPIITLIPFILTGVGFGFRAKLLVVVLSSIFPILLSVMEGVRSMPPQLLDVARVHRSSEPALWVDLLIPYTTAHAITGIRQGIAGAIVGTIIAEFFLNPNGVGNLLVRGAQTFDAAEVMGVTLVVSLIAVALMGVAGLVERRLLVWRDASTG